MRMQIWKSWSMALGLGGVLLLSPSARADLSTRACAASSAAANGATAGNLVVRRIVTDRMLQRRWALIEDCSHPARPLRMFPLPSSPAPTRSVPVAKTVRPALHPVTAAEVERLLENNRKPRAARVAGSVPAASRVVQEPVPEPLLVRAGDRVHLWSDSANVHLEVEAVALDYGHAGQIVHLRRLAGNASQRVLLSGRVVGADSVELLP